MAGYTDNEQNVILAEASKLDIDDIMAFGPHYFGCGWMKYKYYNLNYAVALSLIGRLYGDKESKNSITIKEWCIYLMHWEFLNDK